MLVVPTLKAPGIKYSPSLRFYEAINFARDVARDKLICKLYLRIMYMVNYIRGELTGSPLGPSKPIGP